MLHYVRTMQCRVIRLLAKKDQKLKQGYRKGHKILLTQYVLIQLSLGAQNNCETMILKGYIISSVQRMHVQHLLHGLRRGVIKKSSGEPHSIIKPKNLT